MTALADEALVGIWRSWSVRTRVLLVAGVVALTAGGAVAAYAILKRDADVECPPPCKLEVEEPPKPKEIIKTVNWPVYGYDDQRTRYLPTKRVRPPYDASEWSFQAGKLLEFSPIVADGTLYFVDKDAGCTPSTRPRARSNGATRSAISPPPPPPTPTAGCSWSRSSRDRGRHAGPRRKGALAASGPGPQRDLAPGLREERDRRQRVW